jgi:hypothetical protein
LVEARIGGSLDGFDAEEGKLIEFCGKEVLGIS